MWQAFRGNRFIGWLGLFTSFGTLLCCALPSTLVLLGLGTSLAGFLSRFPELIWPSEHKATVFALSFFMLAASFVARRYSEKQVCPVERREDCRAVKGVSSVLFYVSALINVVGAFYAFILPRIL